ncbi:hypothetical protein R6Q59_020172 [Mikania micrantha]
MASSEEVVAPSECSPSSPETSGNGVIRELVLLIFSFSVGCTDARTRLCVSLDRWKGEAEKWLPNLVLGLPIANTHTPDGVCSTGTGEGVDEAGDCVGLDAPEMMVAEGGRWCLASYFRLK